MLGRKSAYAGPRVGRFELGRELGTGGYGRVLAAIDPKAGEVVAAKAIDTQGSMDRKRAIAHEIRMLRRLNHSNVIGLRGYEEVGTTCYIFMELASKGDLFEIVLAQGALTECEARPIFAQTMAAVAHLHERGVVHRDIKLENIVLTADGDAKLCDFGLAHAYEKAGEGSAIPYVRAPLTRVCGSESYMAPEVPLRRGYDGLAADVWSSGIVLFAMLSGSFPFDAAAVSDWRYRRVLNACTADPSTSVVHTVFGCFERPCPFSGQAVSLIDALLRPSPPERCTAAAARRMEWVRLPSLQLMKLLRKAAMVTLAVTGFAARRAVLPSTADPGLMAFERLRIASSSKLHSTTFIFANGKLPDTPSPRCGRRSVKAPPVAPVQTPPPQPHEQPRRRRAGVADEALTLDERLAAARSSAPLKARPKRGRSSNRGRASLTQYLMPTRRRPSPEEEEPGAEPAGDAAAWRGGEQQQQPQQQPQQQQQQQQQQPCLMAAHELAQPCA